MDEPGASPGDSSLSGNEAEETDSDSSADDAAPDSTVDEAEPDTPTDEAEPEASVPTELVLSKSSVSCKIGSSVYISVASDMGEGVSYSITPPLPEGLEFNVSTGDITGYAWMLLNAYFTVTATSDEWAFTDGFSLEVTSTQPDGFIAAEGVWVNRSALGFQCVTDDDCHEYDSSAPTFCNKSAAGGICMGCTENSHCPGISQCSYGSCLEPCDNDDDCGAGRRCSSSLGFCTMVKCEDNSDCADGYYCQLGYYSDSSGMCSRWPVE